MRVRLTAPISLIFSNHFKYTQNDFFVLDFFSFYKAPAGSYTSPLPVDHKYYNSRHSANNLTSFMIAVCFIAIVENNTSHFFTTDTKRGKENLFV